MIEDRKEIKEGVKSKLIDILAEQISKEDDFEKLKKELSKELLDFEIKVTEKETKKNIFDSRAENERTQTYAGRPFNKEGGLFPKNAYEEMYKKMHGFVYDPEPINERFKDKIDHFGGKPGNIISTPFDADENTINSELIIHNEKTLAALISEQIKIQRENLQKNAFEDKFKIVENDPKINEESFESLFFKKPDETQTPPTIADKKEEWTITGMTSDIGTLFDTGKKPKRKYNKSNSQKSLKKKPGKRKG